MALEHNGQYITGLSYLYGTIYDQHFISSIQVQHSIFSTRFLSD